MKLAEVFKQTSRNENSSDYPVVRNSQMDVKQVSRRPLIPEVAGGKPVSSQKVWTKFKSGLFGWKQLKSVSVPPKPSHGKLSKISTQTKIWK